MQLFKNHSLRGAANRPFLVDVYHPATRSACPVVLFVHGFKGFKDWGHWHLIASAFCEAGFAFVAFNFSHNGTTPEHPSKFVDLEAFGNNNYSKELFDLKVVIDWLVQSASDETGQLLGTESLYLIGHSRGGGTGLVKAAQDERINAMISWASVSHLDYSWRERPKLVDQWKQEGVQYIQNSRTGQQMPLYVQLLHDFEKHQPLMNIQHALAGFHKPLLIVHGDTDPAVPVAAAEQLHSWHSASELHIVKGADHVFGGKHPFEQELLPVYSQELVKVSIDFLLQLN